MMTKQKGFGLLEISLALILSALLLAFTVREQIDGMLKSTAEAKADQLIQLQKGVSDYIEQHRAAVVNGLSIEYSNDQTDSDGSEYITSSGANALLTPTVEQLVLLDMLPRAFASRAAKLDELYEISLWVEPTGCTGQNCLVEGMVYTRDPIRQPGQSGNAFDGDTVAHMLSRLGGFGFASFISGGELIGAGGSFALPNPHPDSPPGIVGLLVNSEINRDSITPIAGLDYCPGGLYFIPLANDIDNGVFYDPSNEDLNGWVNAYNNQGCVLQFDDIPRGFTTMAVDPDPPKVGWTRISCSADGQPGLVLSDTGPTNKNCNGDYGSDAAGSTSSVRITPGSS